MIKNNYSQRYHMARPDFNRGKPANVLILILGYFIIMLVSNK